MPLHASPSLPQIQPIPPRIPPAAGAIAETAGPHPTSDCCGVPTRADEQQFLQPRADRRNMAAGAPHGSDLVFECQVGRGRISRAKRRIAGAIHALQTASISVPSRR